MLLRLKSKQYILLEPHIIEKLTKKYKCISSTIMIFGVAIHYITFKKKNKRKYYLHLDLESYAFLKSIIKLEHLFNKEIFPRLPYV